ncbi:LysR substrate-binding domain-containing protein [Caenimonas aquaedulcis]|uniref:LysR family transcriptional regulator n=1 Tax=Caenimonas aquaedulcis TaxID=2793270 RepID=A0A931MHW6_9BURK|nr:LysR substrate-binding domain-containing protein [Caenimonas aquaedulcis]MBG9389506.1 LysR family transcriptional regulator [Caenimonas aquaedulcis]
MTRPAVPALPSGFARNVQLRHLRCLVAVAQERNLARAAERLALSQPAVSKTLAELEALSGRRLVERGRKGARLTAAGEDLLAHALRVLDAVGEAAESMEGGTRAAGARLRLGALPSVAPAWLPRALAAFGQAQPQVTVTLTTAPNAPLLESLRSGQLDAVLGRIADPQHMAGLSFELLQAESLAVVTRPGHPLAGLPAASIHAVLEYPLVVYGEGTIPRHSTDSFLSSWGLKLPATRRLETLDVAVARLVVRDSDSVWFTPLGAAADDLAQGTLVRLALPTPGTEEPVGLLVRSDADLPVHAREFIAQLRTLAGRSR